MTKLPLLCQYLDDVQPIAIDEILDFRSFITNDLKVLPSSENISDKQLLILTRKFDPDATRLGIKLLAKGIDSVRLNVEDIASLMKIRYRIDETGDPSLEFTIGERNFNISKIPVVLLREFDNTLMELNFRGKFKNLARRFCYEQWNDSYQILIASLEAEWINKPDANLNASNRILQLTTARKFGLNIPSTLITNDPQSATEFYKNNDGQIVLKAVHHHGVEIDGKIYSMYTRSLTKDDLTALDDLIYAPSILQKRLPKQSELRVTIVGEKIFAAELGTQSISMCRDDLHRYPVSKIPKRAVKLDNSIAEACLKIMNEFDLKYGALDFILDDKNQLYFLEINPTGDWYWIERDTNMPITDTFVNLIENLAAGDKI